MFGDDGLIEVVRSCAGQTPEGIADRVLQASTRHALGEPHDDIAMLVVQVAP
jgi:serine phosphatase RsbU (regulator of sigma subunit)